ncbi:MAG: HlyD family type I secretion periplasmic adaptor subunit [Alphaproteobacteria bacterium]|nr:MAG: HlyD family type I secretion periplasmic adaptor subunit [Alphaproteobacteria bacterium]
MNTYVKNTALLGILTVFTLFIIIWANLVELDEMSRVQGKIIPSSKEKVIQSEFNGRLVKINVKVGDKLKKGEEIARVSDEEIIADQKSYNEDFLRSIASIKRIEAMRDLDIPTFNSSFVKEELKGRADIALEQVEIARTSLNSYKEEVKLIKNQRDQIVQQIKDLKSELISVVETVRLVDDEKKIIEPMVKKGYEPRLRLVQILQKLQDTKARETKLFNQIKLLELSDEELDTKLKKMKSDFLNNLAVEISEQQASKMKSEASLTKVNRRIGASSIVSPDDGIITSLDVTTPGQVIGSGQILATLVPITDELIIEAQLPPADINYISLEQKANIMITAYDVRTYGKLIGEVSKIGANTITNEQDGMSYYPIEIIIRDKTFDMAKDTEAEFIPGMEASVELVGEKRSIAAYLTKPFSQFKSEAFREK